MSDWKSKADWRDPSWKYVPAASTDISKTIARIRRELKEQAKEEQEQRSRKVFSLKKAHQG
jgi:hypothetical protein